MCTSEIKATESLSRQDEVWCLNLSSGDVLTNKKWKQYYDCDDDDDEPTAHQLSYLFKGSSNQSNQITNDRTNNNDRTFKHGTIVGMLIDQNRGDISFYKDGEDLGIAIINKDLIKKELYPFVQIHTNMS